MEPIVGRILHAGYLIQSQETKILFDPVFEIPFSYNCYPFPDCTFDENEIKKLKINAIFISHVHDDHLCFKSLNRFDRNTPIYLYAEDEIYFEMLKSLGFDKVYQLKVNQAVHLENQIRVTPRLALDPNVDCLLHIQIGPYNILNVVDSWVDPKALKDMENIKNWDLVLWPFQTMRELQVLEPSRSSREKEIPIEWAEVLRILNPKAIVPSSCQFQHESWSWYNQALFPISYQEFEDWCKLQIPKSQYVKLEPGQTLQLSDLKRSKPFGFIDLKNPIAEYRYDPDHKQQSLNEIASHFPNLTLSQRDEIADIYTNKIPKFLDEVKDELDPYFTEGCQWILKIYWGGSEVSQFSHSMGMAELKNQWLTEISAYKLWSAVKRGEALTSLYMRINDHVFSDQVEKSLKLIDVTEDPLIKFLFDGKTNQYHLNQLKELGITIN